MKGIEVRKIQRGLRSLGEHLDEAGTNFEGQRFVHARGCTSVRLARSSVEVDTRDITTRTCASCEISDEIKTYRISHVGAPR